MVISVLTKLAYFIPTWKIVPTQDIVDSAFRDPQVRKEVQIFFISLKIFGTTKLVYENIWI